MIGLRWIIQYILIWLLVQNKAFIKGLDCECDCVMISILIVLIPALSAVAFLTLFERHLIGTLQRRAGPNLVWIYGSGQAVADAKSTMISGMIITSRILGLYVMTGFIKHQERYLDMFLPARLPGLLAPAVIVLEILGFTARAISLGVRLSANMLAGHSLLKLICMLIWSWYLQGSFYVILDSLVMFLLFVLLGLEAMVAAMIL